MLSLDLRKLQVATYRNGLTCQVDGGKANDSEKNFWIHNAHGGRTETLSDQLAITLIQWQQRPVT